MNISGLVSIDLILSTSGTKAAAMAKMSPTEIENNHRSMNRNISNKGSCISKVSPIKYRANANKATTITLIENSRNPAVIIADIG
jgi:hypothetical protein